MSENCHRDRHTQGKGKLSQGDPYKGERKLSQSGTYKGEIKNCHRVGHAKGKGKLSRGGTNTGYREINTESDIHKGLNTEKKTIEILTILTGIF